MASVTTYGVKYLNNLSEYGNTYGIPTVSELTAYIGGATTTVSGEVISHARFTVKLPNGTSITSPDIPYDGIGEISYNFGVIQESWVTTSLETYRYLHMNWEVKTNKYVGWINNEPYYYWGWYGDGGQVLPYSLPVITSFNVYRDVLSTTAIYEINAQVNAISGASPYRNVLKYKFQYDDNGTWTDVNTLTTGDVSIDTSYSAIGPYAEDESYRVRVVLQDKFNTVYAYDVLPTVLVPLSIGKFGIGVGKIIENEDAALDINGKFYRDNISQPKIFNKKPSDPDPDGMEEGDVLLIYNELEAFSSTNFPQQYGTGYSWSQVGTWPNDYNYWTSMASTSNSIVDSFECSTFKGSAYPHLIFDGSTSWDNNIMLPYGALPAQMVIKFKGTVQFNSFTLHGWAQGHEPKNSPKSFAFFGSNDGHTWISLYDTTAFTDTYNGSATGTMSNSGLYFKYLKMVWRTNQNDNNTSDLTNATMIAFREITFNVSGYKYV